MTMILLSSGLLILLLIALRPLMKKWVSPVVRYSLWLLVALRLLMPFQLGSSSLSLENLLPKDALSQVTEEQASVTTDPQTQSNGMSHSPVLPDSELSAEENLSSPTAPHSSDPTPYTPVDPPSVESVSPSIPSKEPSDIPSRFLTRKQILSGIWFAGFLTMAFWFLTVNIRFHKKAKENAHKLDIPHSPLSVYETQSVPSPCLIGLFRPRIFLLPQMDPRQRRHILAHEYTHYRHWDHIWSLVRVLCLCVYWFNPLVWIAAYFSKEDCELACDYSTILSLGEEERLPYGRTLLDTLVQANYPGSLLSSATTMGGSKRQLRTRMENIVEKPKKLLWALVSLFLIVALSVGCTFTGKQDPPPPRENEPTYTEPSGNFTHTEAAEEAETEAVHSEAPDAYVATNYEADGYAIPKLLSDSPYAQQVNKEIQERFGRIAQGDRSQYQSLSYEYSVMTLEDIASPPSVLVLEIHAVDRQNHAEHLRYYMDLATGLELSGTTYAEEIKNRISHELVQELYDEQVNTGSISFTEEDQKIYAENMLHCHNDAWIEVTPRGTLTFVIPYRTMDGRLRDLTLKREPTESISVNAFYDPQVMELFTYVSENGTKSSVPFILLDTTAARDCNVSILRNYLYLLPNQVTYSQAIRGDILSIAVTAWDPSDGLDICLAENLFLNKNSTVSPQEVLAQADPPMTVEEYIEKASILFPSYFFDLFPGITEEFSDDTVTLQVLRCGTKANIENSTPYLDQEGNVWARAKIYQIAGAESTGKLIPISTGKINEEYIAFAEKNGIFTESKTALLTYLETLYGEGNYELLYTAENAFPEYVDSSIQCEALQDHVTIRIFRNIKLHTFTEEEVFAIPEVSAAIRLLKMENRAEIVSLVSSDEDEMNPFIFEGLICHPFLAESRDPGSIDRYIKFVYDITAKEMYILIFYGP